MQYRIHPKLAEIRSTVTNTTITTAKPVSYSTTSSADAKPALIINTAHITVEKIKHEHVISTLGPTNGH